MGRNGLVLTMILLVAASCLSGCATGSDEVKSELRTLREELRAEIQDQREESAALLETFRKENRAERERIAADIRGEMTEEIGRFKNAQDEYAAEWDARLRELSDRTEKTSRNCDVSILEMRKELFQTKRAAEERRRRLEVLESAVDPGAEFGEPAARGAFVTFIEGNLVSISIGPASAIKEGATINIFKKNEPDKKIATAKVTSVDAESASGEIFYTVDTVQIGDRAEVAKE